MAKRPATTEAEVTRAEVARAKTSTDGDGAFRRRLQSLSRDMAGDRRLAALILSSATGVAAVAPRVLRLRLLLACDARCRMCLIHSPLRTVDLFDAAEVAARLPEPLAARLMDEGRALGAEVLNLQGGEPFLYPSFAEVLGRAVSLGYLVQFFTNGGDAADIAVVERALAAARGGARVSMRISIDAAGAAHDDIRGVPGAYRRATAFARRALRLAQRQSRLEVGVSCTVMRYNADDLLALADHFASLGLFARFIPVVACGPRRRDDGAIVAQTFLPAGVLPDARQRRAIARALPELERHPAVESAALLHAAPRLWSARPYRNVCVANSIGLYVTATGRLQFCPISVETVAGVHDTPLAAAWSRVLQGARRQTFTSCLVPCTCYRPDRLV